MPTVFSHAIVAAAIGTVVAPSAHMPRRFWVLGAVASTLPDADVLAFGFGLPYEHLFGHRGITHSLLFAGIMATALVFGAFGGESWRIHRGRLWLYVALVTASHGWLDAMTTGGRGIAFLARSRLSAFFCPGGRSSSHRSARGFSRRAVLR